MPKYDFRHPTLSSNVTLTYPTSSGTFALTSQIAGGFSLNNASGSRLIISDGTTTAATASATLTYVSPYLTLSGSTALTSTPDRFLTLRHDSTGTTATGFGVGIDFRGEDAAGTTNLQFGTLDYEWEAAGAVGRRGMAEISLHIRGALSGSKLITTGMEHSFGGGSSYTAAHTELADSVGRYPNYRVYMKGQTSDATLTALLYANSSNSAVLAPANDTTWMFTAYIVGRRTDVNDQSAAYWIRGAIDNNANVIDMIGDPLYDQLEDIVGWQVAVGDGGGTGLAFEVAGAVGASVNWNGYVDIVQVSG